MLHRLTTSDFRPIYTYIHAQGEREIEREKMMKKSNMSRVFGQNVEEAGGMVIFLPYLHGNGLFCALVSSFPPLARMEFLNTSHNTLISQATPIIHTA
jgi:hypothetical protein